MVENCAARVIVRAPRRCHITPVLSELHWLPVRQRVEYKVLLLTYKAKHGLAPSYLSDMLVPYVPGRPLRSAESDLLVVPVTKLKTYGGRAFSTAAPSLWNKLPSNVKAACSVDIFKKLLKTHLF